MYGLFGGCLPDTHGMAGSGIMCIRHIPCRCHLLHHTVSLMRWCCAAGVGVSAQAAVERVEKQMERMGDITTDHRAVQVCLLAIM